MQIGQCLFRPGDQVSLPGGAVMTVRVATPVIAYCVWAEGERSRHGTFARDSLQCRCDPSPQPPAMDRKG